MIIHIGKTHPESLPRIFGSDLVYTDGFNALLTDTSWADRCLFSSWLFPRRRRPLYLRLSPWDLHTNGKHTFCWNFSLFNCVWSTFKTFTFTPDSDGQLAEANVRRILRDLLRTQQMKKWKSNWSWFLISSCSQSATALEPNAVQDILHLCDNADLVRLAHTRLHSFSWSSFVSLCAHASDMAWQCGFLLGTTPLRFRDASIATVPSQKHRWGLILRIFLAADELWFPWRSDSVCLRTQPFPCNWIYPIRFTAFCPSLYYSCSFKFVCSRCQPPEPPHFTILDCAKMEPFPDTGS